MIPFSPPRIDQKVIDEVVDTLKSGWITTGPKTKEFERRLTAYCGNKATLAVNSNTVGLEVVLRWFGVQEGDEVIVPAYTYCATANVIVHCGAKPVMVDVNADDFDVCLEKVREAITDKTKVIMPVDLGGMPCAYDELFELVEAEDVKTLFQAKTEEQRKLGRILILSDSAHSIGAEYKGRKAGCLADVSVFSFHAVKNLTTAEGGAIMLNLPEPFDNEEVYRYLCTYTLHGQNKDALAKTKRGAWRYDVLVSGFKGNMTDIMASIGLVELSRYEDDTLHYRKCIYDQYTDAFARYGWAELPIYETEDRKSSYHVYCLRVKGITEQQRDEIIQRIFDKDVSVNVHFQPLPLLSAFKNKGYKIEDYPVAYDNYCREISLPVWYGLSEEMVKTVIDAVICSVEEVLA
ncbi:MULTISPECIES: DegT/DnrJ/EryC1/StrS family aminotransferase [Butyricimonas]|jgi:aminotransferase|uniref:dTDP-4-amino-4,6-dideoxygalactose transaminase n=1 Tax=Butyricimonas faecihominis TaxID=1472416 RepID=A0A7W6MXA4_9BACT|nr:MULTISPECIES: DegT/DnrJ/EryC1/StrS family aminotransferase [Butyricimonas]MBS6688131.1 DegT/DnrJ/EryC1/StrS family aminotransferase [Sanguibacteroides justesenii]KAB1509130.1 DegT/DnrJ/EryC1/StrS family aminotransferase [Butyricimonas faecihominis]MBB4024814.1 dTDP-4-amino-4,6-dideoxygalactose transaminase [Butyricimonas faecihominis]WOF08375.1 DegT/DnrJ/EryC1/StrS family aminotransferase [Butyricimonas faecihominis]BEI55485.1 DegT/DnrJ/EryC1/StrS family aminotransferase [Butyricimonas faec